MATTFDGTYDETFGVSTPAASAPAPSELKALGVRDYYPRYGAASADSAPPRIFTDPFDGTFN